MIRSGAILLGSFTALVTTVAYGQVPGPALSTTLHVTPAPYYLPFGEELGDGQAATPQLTVGGFVVHVWAPMEAPYNTDADRNLAADPVWGTE